MEVYSTFQIKDHYYWVEETNKPEAKPAPAPKPQPTKPAEKPRYKSWAVREADGSTAYYDAQINSKPVRMGGIMI